MKPKETQLTFYYSKGSSALAAHILLYEVNAYFKAVEVSIADGEHRAAEHLKRNPKGRIPVLGTPSGYITENPAILEYIAAVYPDAGTLPTDDYGQAKARELAAYLAATAHVAFAHKHRGTRWAREASSIADMQGKTAENLADCAAYLEASLAFAPFALGAQYSFCDPYLFQFTRWLEGACVPTADFQNLSAHRDHMRRRASTCAAMAIHGLT